MRVRGDKTCEIQQDPDLRGKLNEKPQRADYVEILRTEKLWRSETGFS